VRTTGAALAADEWASRADAICTAALSDEAHQLVGHLDAQHVRLHGRAIVAVGTGLQRLGAPAGAGAAYPRLLKLYMRSAVYHVAALDALDKGEQGQAAEAYAIALSLADQADKLAAGLGAVGCSRFGMTG
jgi:hypothetical protein